MRPDLNIYEIWVYLSGSPLLALILTLTAYQIGVLVYERSQLNPLANPVLIAVTLIAVTITVSGNVHQKRRRKSTNSGFCSSSSDGMTGSRVIPQIGQLPGALWRICGCIGQV